MREPRTVNIHDIKREIPEVGVGDMDVFGKGDKYNHDMLPIVDHDNKRVLGVFDSGYKLVKHEEVLDAFHEVIQQDEFLGNYFCDGKRMHVYYYPDDWERRVQVGHDMQDKDRGDEDEVLLGFRVTNSVDGSNALKASLIGFRQICSNGMWGEELIEREYQRHTSSLSVDTFKKELDNMIEFDLDDITKKIERSSEFHAETENVLDLLRLPKSLKEEIQKRVPDATTLWDIYNEATKLITHGYREEKGVTLTADDYSEEYLERIHRNASKILTLPDRQNVNMQKVEA